MIRTQIVHGNNIPDVRVHGKNGYEKYVHEQKYEIMEQIGRGGNGIVMNARDRQTNQMLVCKAVPKTNARGKQELISMMRMQGGNTIKLHDFYEDESNYYIIMDKGWKDLHNTHVETYETIAESEVKRIIASVLKTLCLSHAKRILHLDIKAGNLLWLDDQQKKLVLIDWGLSLLVPKGKDYVEMDGYSGTPWFMAPEQLRSEASQKSDVWAVGVLCAQLLTKRFPFNDARNSASPSVAAIWRSILMDDLNTDTTAWRNISNEAKHFVKWVLCKDPSTRPTALDALNHPWLTECRTIADEGVARLKRMHAMDDFQKACIEELARRLSISPVLLASSLPESKQLRQSVKTREELQELFKELDEDQDGVITCVSGYDEKENITWESFEEYILKDPLLPLYVFDG